MKLIVGLGNPGKRYENNRHNVGFMVVDRLQTTDYSDTPWEEDKKFQAVVCRPKTVDIIFVKPQTFMNESGRAVAKLVKWYKIEPNNIYVIHDDLDLPLGEFKIQKGKGPRLHNGIRSIDQAIGTSDYWRVRIGVENRRVPRVPRGEPARNASQHVAGGKYVLADFTKEEEKIISEVVDKVVEELVSKLT